MEDKILLYSELPPQEQRAVEEHVARHPELLPTLEEAKAFKALLHEALLLCADPPGDEALAYYLATRHISPHPVPASLREAFAHIEARLTDDASLRAHYEVLSSRMAALEAASDPVEQFERLTGHRLPRLSRPAPGQRAEVVASEAASLATSRPVILRLWGQAGRWIAAAVVFLVALYGALALMSHLSQSDLERLAALESAAFDGEGLRMRSGVTPPSYASSEALYRQALPLLHEARKHTLGLFPRYDQRLLSDAAVLLERVVAQDPAASPLRSEAYYLLAKVRLAQGDAEGAKAALRTVLSGTGWRVPEARTLLEQLEALRL